MFGISGEHIVVLGIILLVFGPKRLPQIGNTLGKAIKNFKDGIAGVEEASYRKLGDQAEVKPVTAADAKPAATTADDEKKG